MKEVKIEVSDLEVRILNKYAIKNKLRNISTIERKVLNAVNSLNNTPTEGNEKPKHMYGCMATFKGECTCKEWMGMDTPTDTHESTSNPVVDHNEGNVSDKTQSKDKGGES